MKDLTSTQTITVTVDNPTKVNNVIYTGSYNSGYAKRRPWDGGTGRGYSTTSLLIVI